MPNKIQTEEELIERIWQRYEDEKPLDSESVDKDPEDFWLLEAAKRFYGEKHNKACWRFALKKADIDLAEIQFEPRTDEKFYNEKLLAKPGKNPKRAERKLLEKLQRDEEFCEKYCANLHQTIIHLHGLDVSNRIVPCLEYLLSRKDADETDKKGILFSGKYKTKTFVVNSGKHKYHHVFIAGNKYYLAVPSKESSKSIDCIVELYSKRDEENILVTTGFDEIHGEQRNRTFQIRTENNFLSYTILKNQLFNNCSGVEIRSISKSRRIQLPNGRGRLVDRKTKGDYVIFIFERGKYHLFNLFGEKVENCLPRGEIQKEKCRKKISRLESEYADFDREKFIRDSRDYLIKQWAENSSEWGRDGRSIIIEGASYVYVQKAGSICFQHITNDKEKGVIHVGKDFKGKRVKSIFRGPIVFFGENDKKINAYAPNHPIGFECRRVEQPNTEYLRVKDITNLKGDVSFENSKKRVVIKKSKIAAAAGMNLEGITCALMAHVKKNFSEKDIELLMITKEGEIISKKIVPEEIKKEQIEANELWPAAKAIDYLFMTTQEKIEFRVNNRLTLQQWFNQFKPVLLEGDYVETTDVRDLFKFDTITKLSRRGYFGKITQRGVKRYVDVSIVNELLVQKSKLIPVPLFHERIRDYYLEKATFNEKYAGFFKIFLDKQHKFVTIVDAARIASSLRQRREMFNWPTLEDLNRESGMCLVPQNMNSRYKEMYEKGDLELVKTWNQFRIPPKEYRQILKLEKERVRVLNSGLSTGDIARRFNLHISTVYENVIECEKKGIITPMRGSKTSAYSDRIVLTEEQAMLIFRKE